MKLMSLFNNRITFNCVSIVYFTEVSPSSSLEVFQAFRWAKRWRKSWHGLCIYMILFVQWYRVITCMKTVSALQDPRSRLLNIASEKKDRCKYSTQGLIIIQGTLTNRTNLIGRRWKGSIIDDCYWFVLASLESSLQFPKDACRGRAEKGTVS